MTRLSRHAGPLTHGITALALLAAAPVFAQEGEDLQALAERLRASGAAAPAPDAQEPPLSATMPPEIPMPDSSEPLEDDLTSLHALAERAGGWARERPTPGFSATDRLGKDLDRFEALFPLPAPGTEAPLAPIPGADLPPCDLFGNGLD